MANKSWLTNEQYNKIFGQDISNSYSIQSEKYWEDLNKDIMAGNYDPYGQMDYYNNLNTMNDSIFQQYNNENKWTNRTSTTWNNQSGKILINGQYYELNQIDPKVCYDTNKTIISQNEKGIVVDDANKQQTVLINDNNIHAATFVNQNGVGSTVYFTDKMTVDIENSQQNTDASKKQDTNLPGVTDQVGNNSNQSVTNESAETANETPEPTISDANNASIDSVLSQMEAKNAVTEKINSITNTENNPYHKPIYYSKKVSLNVAPINKLVNISSTLDKESWESRLGYILGDDTSKLLYSLFGSTRGIVFPYTPSIKMEHAVSYEQSDIIHSNLSVQHYKNTPPPSINITADFTADNQENALYMYGVMCFLRAMTKCEFGVQTIKRGKEGVPPPILYLNGWGNMINNIPVVITSFSIDLPKDKHYISLFDGRYGGIDVWLPTQMTFSIQLKIQFNLDKYKHQFDLNEYKNGILTSNTQTENNVSIINTLDTKKNGENIVLYDSSKRRTFNGSGWTW